MDVPLSHRSLPTSGMKSGRLTLRRPEKKHKECEKLLTSISAIRSPTRRGSYDVYHLPFHHVTSLFAGQRKNLHHQDMTQMDFGKATSYEQAPGYFLQQERLPAT